MKIKNYRIALILSFFVITLAACNSSPQYIGDAGNGKNIFNSVSIGEGPGCSTCHLIEIETIKIGPSLNGIATRAESRIDGMTAEEYITQSILDPNAYIVKGFPASVMYQEFSEQLSDEDLIDLVTFLITLE